MSLKQLVKKIKQDLDSLEMLPEILRTIQTKSSFNNMVLSIKSMLKDLLKDNRLEIFTMDLKATHARDVTNTVRLKVKESLRYILLKTSKHCTFHSTVLNEYFIMMEYYTRFENHF